MPVLEREKTINLRTAYPRKIDSGAFRNEYKDVPTQAIIDDVVSYLGEYRFNLSKYSYNFKFRNGQLMDPNRNDAMEEACQRAIDLKIKEGRYSIREQRELIGFQSLNRQLLDSRTGDAIIWASPPGPKSEGYGDYGFVYFGKVKEVGNGEKNIKMTAIRVENPSMEQFRKAIYMLTGEKENFKSAEEFLNSPKVINEDIKEDYVETILKMVFGFKPNIHEEARFRKIIDKMFPLIYDFVINRLRKREDLYALENYALELKKEYYQCGRDAPLRLRGLGDIYRNEPPKVAGSCGSTGSSNNIFNSISSINSLFAENKWFTCPECGYKADGPVGNKCPGCGITKEEFAKEGSEVCD